MRKIGSWVESPANDIAGTIIGYVRMPEMQYYLWRHDSFNMEIPSHPTKKRQLGTIYLIQKVTDTLTMISEKELGN